MRRLTVGRQVVTHAEEESPFIVDGQRHGRTETDDFGTTSRSVRGAVAARYAGPAGPADPQGPQSDPGGLSGRESLESAQATADFLTPFNSHGPLTRGRWRRAVAQVLGIPTDHLFRYIEAPHVAEGQQGGNEQPELVTMDAVDGGGTCDVQEE